MKKRVGKILFWLCIVVCVLGVAYIAIYYFRKDKNEDVYQKVQKQVCTFRINGAPFPRQRCKRLAPAVRYPFVVTC